MATHSSILAWRTPGTEEPGGLPSMGSQSRTRLKWLSSSSNYWNSKEKLLGKTLRSYEQLHFCNENPHVLSEHSVLISNMTRPHALLGSSRNPFPWFGNKIHFPEVLRKITPTKTPLQSGQPTLGLLTGHYHEFRVFIFFPSILVCWMLIKLGMINWPIKEELKKKYTN